MPTPDVRVRLSAEGQEEVVAAFRKVQAQSNAAGAAGGRSFTGFNRVLGSTANLLGTLGVALGARAFFQWIRGASEGADAIGKLSIRTGASVENLSALHLITRTNQVDLENLQKALVKELKSLGDARAGTIKQVNAFKDLGIEIKDLEGLDAVQIFERISQKIVTIPSAADRARISMDIFGRSGAQLLPAMQQLAEEGLQRVIDRARDLGVLIDSDLAAATRSLNDDLELLKAQSQGLGTRLAAGLAPPLSQALQIVTGDLSQTRDAWQAFGEGLGTVIKFIVSVVSSGFDIVGTALGVALIGLDSGTRVLVNLFKGRLGDAERAGQAGIDAIKKQTADLYARLQARDQLLLHAPPKPKPNVEIAPPGGDETDPAYLAARRAEALQTNLDRELSIVRSNLSLRNQAEKRSFEEGLVGVQEYYSRRRQIAAEQLDKELSTLQEKRKLLALETDPARREQEAGKIAIEEQKTRTAYENQIADLLFQERQETERLAQTRLALEQRLLSAQGRRHDAALLNLEEEARKAEDLFRKQGLTGFSLAAQVARVYRTLRAPVDFEETKRQAEQAFKDLGTARQAIESRVSAGLVSQIRGEQQIIELERQRLEQLRELAALLIAAAKATGDPDKIAAAQEFADSIGAIAEHVKASADAVGQFQAAFENAAQGALTDFLDEGITKSKKLKDAFRDMALSIIADLRRLAAEILATQILKSIIGLFGGGGQVGGGGSKAEEKATGGPLGAVPAAPPGPLAGIGGGKTDSNLGTYTDQRGRPRLLRFSRGEYLMPEATSRDPVVFRHLEDLRARGRRALMPSLRMVPGYATGGSVGEVQPGGIVDRQAGAGRGEVLMQAALEPGLVLKTLSTRSGRRGLLRLVAEDRSNFRAALRL